MNIISIVSFLQLVVPAVSLLVPSTKVIEPCSALTAREGSIGSSVNCFAGAFPSYESDIDDFQIRNQGVSRRSMLTRFLGFLTMSVTTQGTALAAEPVTAKDTDSLLVVAKRKFRPKPPKLLRRRLSQDFAVLLMRSSYNALDELDCVAMDQFQRDFFLIRSSEYETYTNALGNGLVQQGDLTDPYYFDFISFVQYKTINRELTENPPYVFEEQQLITEGSAEDEAGRARFVPVVVKRDPGLTNAMLVPTHASKVGAKILDRFEEMFGQSDARIPNVDKNSNSAALLAAIRQLLNLFLISGYAFRGDIAMAGQSPDDGTKSVTAGTKFVATLEAPAILWGGRILQLEGDPLSNDFFTKTAVELIRRAGESGENKQWSEQKCVPLVQYGTL